jgi:hypothetical protein
MNTNHTLKPWQVETAVGFGSTEYYVGSDGDNYAIASDIRDADGKPSESNARLIAAAPSMLEALHAVVTAWEDPEMGWIAADKVRDAMAKASLPNG